MGPLNRFRFIYPIAFMASVAFTLVTVGSVFFLQHRYGVGASAIGQYAAEWALTYMAGCLLLKNWLPRQPVGRVVLVALPLLGGLTLGVLLMPSFWLCHLLNLFSGFMAAMFWPPLMGWASAGLTGKDLSRKLGWYNLTWSTGTILGPAAAGSLARLNPGLPLWIAAALFLTAAAVMILARWFGAEAVDRVGGDGNHDAPAGADPHRMVRYSAWVGLFATHTLIGVILNIFPIFAQKDLALGTAMAGVFLSLRSLFTASSFLAIGRLSFWHRRHGPLLLNQIMILAVLAVAMAGRTPGLFLACLLALGILLAFSYVESLFHSAEGAANPSGRMAWHESILTGGILAGALAGGFLYDHRGMPWVWGFCGLLILVASGFQTVLAIRSRASRINP